MYYGMDYGMTNFMNPFGMQPNFMDLMSNPMYSIPMPMFNPFSMPMSNPYGLPMGGMPMNPWDMSMGMGNPYAMPMGTPQMPYGGNIWDMQMQQQYQMPYGYNAPQYGYRPGYTGNGGYNPVFDINRDGKLDDADTFAVIGATIADNFGVEMPEGTIGGSILSKLN